MYMHMCMCVYIINMNNDHVTNIHAIMNIVNKPSHTRAQFTHCNLYQHKKNGARTQLEHIL